MLFHGMAELLKYCLSTSFSAQKTQKAMGRGDLRRRPAARPFGARQQVAALERGPSMHSGQATRRRLGRGASAAAPLQSLAGFGGGAGEPQKTQKGNKKHRKRLGGSGFCQPPPPPPPPWRAATRCHWRCMSKSCRSERPFASTKPFVKPQRGVSRRSLAGRARALTPI